MSQAQPLMALTRIAEELLAHENGSILFLNAQYEPGGFLDKTKIKENLICEQAWRPQYLALQNAGLEVYADLPTDKINYQTCILVWGKFRQLNEAMVNRARTLVAKGGLIIITGAKTDGIASARKRFAKEFELEDSYSKFHSMVLWFKNPGTGESLQNGQRVKTITTDDATYETTAGLFSADKVDRGSALLARHFDNKISGFVADLGAGWGYLSCQLLRKSSNVNSLEMFEGNWHGVEACRKNTNCFKTTATLSFHWHDIQLEHIDGKFDWVIMNPPFHQATHSNLDLGIAFIERASTTLKPGGQMIMVANRHLAYETTLARCFKKSKTLQETQGFKIIIARK